MPLIPSDSGDHSLSQTPIQDENLQRPGRNSQQARNNRARPPNTTSSEDLDERPGMKSKTYLGGSLAGKDDPDQRDRNDQTTPRITDMIRPASATCAYPKQHHVAQSLAKR